MECGEEHKVYLPKMTIDQAITMLFFQHCIPVGAIARVFQAERRDVEFTIRTHYADLRRAYAASEKSSSLARSVLGSGENVIF